MTQNINTTANNNTMNVYVILHSHSEYCGFSVFGGVFRTKEEAIAEAKKRMEDSHYPTIEIRVIEETHRDRRNEKDINDIYVIPIRESDMKNIERINEDLADEYYGAHDVAYNLGGLLITEQTI